VYPGTKSIAPIYHVSKKSEEQRSVEKSTRTLNQANYG